MAGVDQARGQQPGLAPAADHKVDFATEVHPILVGKCLSCHSGVQAQGGLSVERVDGMIRGGQSGAAIKPGDGENSLLMQRVTGEKEPRMPIGGQPLGAEEIGLLRAWIDQGAEWDPDKVQVTSVVPIEPREPEIPQSNLLGSSNPVDRFVGAYFASKAIEAPRPVSDALFARRAYLDLWGITPNPEQIDQLVRDNSSGKRAALVDRLLADKQKYTEHWISFWNDLLRNDEGVIYHGERKTITDWLRSSLENNKPYDDMVRDLLNPLKESDPEGYLIGVTWRGVVNASQRAPMQAAQNSAQVFLGINLKCASCHDSFINQWKLKDSYGLASLFSDEPLELVRCDAEMGVIAEPKFLYPQFGKIDTASSMAERREFAAKVFTAGENGRFSRTLVNRYWQRLFGRGIVETLDDMDQPAWNADLLDWLASDFASHDYDLKHLLRLLMTSATYQLPAVSMKGKNEKEGSAAEFVFQGPYFRRLTAEQFADSVSAITGEWRVQQPKEPVDAKYVREWQAKSSPLTRALGRVVRDQVITERNEAPTTLQALELVNGETLTRVVQRGARRLLGRLEPAPRPLFHSGVVGMKTWEGDKVSERTSFEVDVTGLDKLYLMTVDYDSYDRERVIPVWVDAQLTGPNGVTPLAKLAEQQGVATREAVVDEVRYEKAIAGSLPTTHVFDLRGKKFKTFRARIAYADESKDVVVMPSARFFVFGGKPSPRDLIPVAGEPPFPMHRLPGGPGAVVASLYEYAFARKPTEGEAREAAQLIVAVDNPRQISTEGLEDLLWILFLSPEFEFIR